MIPRTRIAPLSESADFIPLKRGDTLTQAQIDAHFPQAAAVCQRIVRRMAEQTAKVAS